MSVLLQQEGGDHYSKLTIQPFDLGYKVCEGDSGFVKVAKYITRDKEDMVLQINKAIHVVRMAEVLRDDRVFFAEAHWKYTMLTDFAEQFKYARTIREALWLYAIGEYHQCIEQLKDLREWYRDASN